MKTRNVVLGLITIVMLAMLGACGGKDAGSKEAVGKESTIETIKDRDKFVVGVKYDTKLFGLQDPSTNKVEGFDIDIAREIAKNILGDENKVELVEVTSKTRIPMLNNGDIDAIIATMTITEERKQEVEFSEVYFEAGQSLLVKKDSDIKKVDDLKKGDTVLAVKGSTSAKNIREKSPDTTVREYENYQEAFMALKAGHGNALTTDNSILYGMAQQDSNFIVLEETFTDEPYGIAIKKGDTEFVDEVNKVLNELHESGKYDEIYEKWIGEKPKN
ncbi:transporter substrate-binding domain-containing protein [Siminovitchia terrae]|uniref:Transporter substrate-binding domain-containing protein n=1 Tax=Siminovitchia terrae TaxID=1914933 RepID=A0A429XEA0_SIMTE|nr:transporter substrate-binding domain-containing protein [Siminovitchia terrae]